MTSRGVPPPTSFPPFSRNPQAALSPSRSSTTVQTLRIPIPFLSSKFTNLRKNFLTNCDVFLPRMHNSLSLFVFRTAAVSMKASLGSYAEKDYSEPGGKRDDVFFYYTRTPRPDKKEAWDKSRKITQKKTRRRRRPPPLLLKMSTDFSPFCLTEPPQAMDMGLPTHLRFLFNGAADSHAAAEAEAGVKGSNSLRKKCYCSSSPQVRRNRKFIPWSSVFPPPPFHYCR